MKLLSTFICVLMVTGIVACSKKDNGGGNPLNPAYQRQYGVAYPVNGTQYPVNGMPYGNQVPDAPTVLQIPGCTNPPPMFNGDLYAECNWLASTTDCDSQAVDQIFIQKCYGMPMERPGCEPTVPVVVAACGPTCVNYEDSYVPSAPNTVVQNRPTQIREPARPSSAVNTIERYEQPSPSSRIVVRDGSTLRDNTKNVPKQCIGNPAHDCRYKNANKVDGIRGSVARGVGGTGMIADDFERKNNSTQSFFDKQVEAGNVICNKNGQSRLTYFDYLKVIEKNCYGSNTSPVVETRQESAAPIAETQPLVEDTPADPGVFENVFDSSKCQWIVDIHNMLESANQGVASFSRLYTVKPLASDKKFVDSELKQILTYVNQGNSIIVFPGNHATGSAIGYQVSINDNLLTVGDSTELIKSCEPRQIVTQAQEGVNFITRTYTWDGLKTSDGEIDVQSAVTFNAFNENESKSRVEVATSRLIIWRSGVNSLDDVKNTFQKDKRLTSRLNARNNSLDLTCRTASGGCMSEAK